MPFQSLLQQTTEGKREMCAAKEKQGLRSKEVGEVKSRQTLYSLREFKLIGELKNRITENMFLKKKKITIMRGKILLKSEECNVESQL